MLRHVLVSFALGTLFASTLGPASADERAAGAAAAKGPSWELTLARPGEPGRPFVIEGTLVGLPDSLAIHGAVLYVYHADAHGNYGPHGDSRPRLAGTLHTNIAGGFRIRTVLPGTYDGTPHVHFRVTGPGLDQRGTLSLARRGGAGSDSTYARVPWMLELPGETWAYEDPGPDGGFRCAWKLALRRLER